MASSTDLKKYGLNDIGQDKSRALARPEDLTKIEAKVRRPVIALEEEDYLGKLSFIITRDFFPELHRSLQEKSENEYGISERDLMDKQLKKLTLSKFLNKYSSEDNVSFQKLQEKDQIR